MIFMPMYKKSLLVLLVIALFSAGITYYRLNNQDIDIIDNEEELTDNTPNSMITVYVSGEVNKPGLIQIDSNARVSDAITACGNFTPLADKNAINLAQKLSDGTHIQVPTIKNSATTTSSTNNSSNSPNDKSNDLVNINTATKEELDTLPGVGPATAEKILNYRQEHGNFQSIEDLKNVKGIGEAKFNKLQDKISI